MDVMHKNLSPKTSKALHWERVQALPFHPLENSHSSDVCCCTAAGRLSGCCARQCPKSSSCCWEVARAGTLDQDRWAQSQLSLATSACKSQILYQGMSSLTFLGLSQEWGCSAHTLFSVLHLHTLSSHRSKDFPVSSKCARKSVLPSILSQTEPGTDSHHKGVKEKMQSLHGLPLALPFVWGVPGRHWGQEAASSWWALPRTHQFAGAVWIPLVFVWLTAKTMHLFLGSGWHLRSSKYHYLGMKWGVLSSSECLLTAVFYYSFTRTATAALATSSTGTSSHGLCYPGNGNYQF